ncbi:MAG: EAL domain-containing protein [Rhodospirillales bacterium]|nr:MAG: EAL domain-containing protein [Rhodospirillales bacterium]
MSVVVIVDDRATNLKILRRFAERLGPDVLVQTYDSAVAALTSFQRVAPDLIVTDYVMPGMSGDQFIERCRQDDVTRQVPIIVVTAYEDRDFRYRALDAGASDFLLSPVDAREFCTRARNLLTLRAQKKAIQDHADSLESELAAALHRHAEDIERRERQLRRLVNTVPALIRATHAASTVTLLNDYHQRLFRLGDHRDDLEIAASVFGQSYVERHVRLDRQVIETGCTVSDIEETVAAPDGSERVLLTTKAPLISSDGSIDQVVTVSLDITERKRGEQALLESEQRFRSLVESSVLGIVIVRDGKPVFANRTYATIFGYDDPSEITALETLDPIYAPTEVDRIRHYRAARKAGQSAPIRYEFQGLRKDGSLLWAETQIQEIVWEGAPAFQCTIVDNTLRKEYEERLERQANFDEVTGLPNRVLALDRLRSAVISAQRHHHKVGVLFVDLDHFKKINDTLGHATGDQLLRLAAERLTRCTRAEDTVARLGGDEFTVILPKLASAAHAEPVIQKILDTFSEPFPLGRDEAFISASIGVTVAPNDGSDPQVLMQNADAAMYRAKEQGRNTFHYFTPELNRRAVERMRLESHLLHALDRGELDLHYQPIVDLRLGTVVGAEALLRWTNPALGNVGPDRFIPLAEDTGLIVPIGQWVIDTACAQLAAWRRMGLAAMRLSVNISSRQFRGTNLCVALAEMLRRHDVPSHLLELEITEGLLMDELPQTRANLRDLASLAVRLSLDDFGTGYSSLRYLKQFPVDTLKIDKSFVREVPHDEGDATVVEAIIAMAHRLGLQVIGEGIETQEQLRFLQTAGCDLAQGYYLSRPMTAAAFLRWLEERMPILGGALQESR